MRFNCSTATSTADERKARNINGQVIVQLQHSEQHMKAFVLKQNRIPIFSSPHAFGCPVKEHKNIGLSKVIDIVWIPSRFQKFSHLHEQCL